ncbi:MAG: SHOCT domain-containing protein [Actinobacteria bacterium]|nr:SHOCT domain-containing protein [Actinomycetota bacterium]
MSDKYGGVFEGPFFVGAAQSAFCPEDRNGIHTRYIEAYRCGERPVKDGVSKMSLTAKGAPGSGTLTVDDTAVTISRTRWQSLGPKARGDKRIPISSIGAVQWRDATNVTSGYIQFTIAGAVERGGGAFKAANDENSVLFTKKQQPEFEAIRSFIEARLGRSQAGAPTASVAEQLTQLAQLHQQGLLTAEEFAGQKARLLS